MLGGREGCTNSMQNRSRMTLASRRCRDGARRVFTDQADIACTKREAPWGVPASPMKGELHAAKNHFREADLGTCAYFLVYWRPASNKPVCFLAWPRPQTAMGVPV